MQNKMQDERIINERRKIQSKGYFYIVMILAISLVVQQAILKAPFSQYAVELFLLIGCGVYNLVCNYKKGINLWAYEKDGNRGGIKFALIAGIVVAGVIFWLDGATDFSGWLTFICVYMAMMVFGHAILVKLNLKKQAQIEKELDEDE